MTDLDEIERALAEADCLVSAEAVDAALDRMATGITDVLGGTNPLALVVMNGGLVLAGRLLTRLPFALQLGYLHATRYGLATEGGGLDWRCAPTEPVVGRTVLVLDDILDEGYTLAAILAHLRQAGAEAVYSAVLVDKRHARKAVPDMRADFTGVDVPDRFLFGCGMDYKGYWRNAPAIYAVKGL